MDGVDGGVERPNTHGVLERCHCLPFWMGDEMPWTKSLEAQLDYQMDNTAALCVMRLGRNAYVSLQWETEELCEKLYSSHSSIRPRHLKRKSLARFMLRGFDSLPSSYSSLDSSHPWLCFWILNGLRILGEEIPDSVAKKTISILRACQDSTGGFAGGPGQVCHLAATYAACMALACVGTEEAFSIIDKNGVRNFLYRMRRSSGAFTMNWDGEEDTRAVYCAVAVAVLLDIPLKPLFDLAPFWLADCQTYEGGFGAVPGCEAHGGYTYCAIAALYLLDKPTLCDLNGLLRWLSARQTRYEGGFQGRTNKLVDSCYSFWQGAAFPLVQQVLTTISDSALPMNSWLFDKGLLRQYVLVCCQNADGGICDKPGKGSDYYHTCYALGGLSIALHDFLSDESDCEFSNSELNGLERLHPAFNLTIDAVDAARSFFLRRSVAS